MAKRNIYLGLGLACFLFSLSFVLYLNFSYLGATNKEVDTLIFSQYKWLLFKINLKIFLTYLVIGILFAFFSILLKIEKIYNIILFNLFIWFMFWVRGIKLFPQLFKEQLYTRGFVLKYFQILVTDFTPLILIYVIFIATLVLIGLKKKRILFSGIIVIICFLIILRFGVSSIKDNSISKPNILIFATDSLRPQSISHNGYFRETPNMDKLLAGGANCLNAKSSLARTLPSWTSVLTSTFPPEHKMRHMFPNSKYITTHGNWRTLINEFNKNNYYTAVISDFAGDIFTSVDYGFQRVTSPDFSIENVLKQRCQEIHYFLIGFIINPIGRRIFPEIWGMTLNKDPWYVNKYTKKSIKASIKKKTPFFILYFSSNNHFPYVTKYPYYDYYSKEKYYGIHKYALSSQVIQTFLEGNINGQEKEQIVSLYDNAVKLFDDNLGEILNYLKKCNIDRKTIIIIMSDHGESIYEHNYGLAHGDHLLGEYSNNMVFGVYSPFENLKGIRIKETVRDIDIAPTILDMLDLKIPSQFKGVSLLSVLRGEEFSGLPAYMETGLWYSTTTPFIENKIRISYPGITQLIEVELPSGKIVLKEKYERIVTEAKYKAYQLNEKKYIYMPGEHELKEEFYINEKKIDRKDITDKDFLQFKQKMVDMFKGIFFIDEQGFIREYSTGNQ